MHEAAPQASFALALNKAVGELEDVTSVKPDGVHTLTPAQRF